MCMVQQGDQFPVLLEPWYLLYAGFDPGEGHGCNPDHHRRDLGLPEANTPQSRQVPWCGSASCE